MRIALQGALIGFRGLSPDDLAHTHDALALDAADIYREFGPTAFEMPRSHAAVHEAGHANVERAAGRTVAYCKVSRVATPGGVGWGGFTSVAGDCGYRWRDIPANRRENQGGGQCLNTSRPPPRRSS